MYEHRYKIENQKTIMTDESFQEKLEICILKLEQKAYLAYYSILEPEKAKFTKELKTTRK